MKQTETEGTIMRRQCSLLHYEMFQRFLEVFETVNGAIALQSPGNEFKSTMADCFEIVQH